MLQDLQVMCEEFAELTKCWLKFCTHHSKEKPDMIRAGQCILRIDNCILLKNMSKLEKFICMHSNQWCKMIKNKQNKFYL